MIFSFNQFSQINWKYDLKLIELGILKFVQACDSTNFNLVANTGLTFYAQQTSNIFTSASLYSSTDQCFGCQCFNVVLLTPDTNCNTYINFQYSGKGKFTSSNADGVATGTYVCQYQISCQSCTNQFNFPYGPYVQNVITISSYCYNNCPTICTTGSYSYTSVSIPNSFIVDQYSGSSNLNSQPSVLITQYYNIPSSTCSFSLCQMYSGTAIDSSVSVVYAGTGTSATVIFTINTSTAFNKNLNLGCVIQGTSTIVYSSNSISFTVNACNPTGIDPSMNSQQTSYAYIQYQNGGTVQVNNLQMQYYFSGISSTCYFQQCTFYNGGSIASQVSVSVQNTMITQTLNFYIQTSNSFSALGLTLSCLIQGSASVYSTNSYPIYFQVNPCIFTGLSPNPSVVILNQYQNGGSIIYSGLQVSSYIAASDVSCSLSSCSIQNFQNSPISFMTLTHVTSSIFYVQISTQNPQTSQQLKFKCIDQGGNSYYSGYFQLSINPCSFTSAYHQSYSFNQFDYLGQKVLSLLNYSDFIQPSSSQCTLSNCYLNDQIGNNPSFINLQYIPTSQTYTMKVNTNVVTSTLQNGSTSIQFKCIDQGGNIRNSNYFNVEIICGPKSVIVSPPANFLEIIYYKINVSTQANFIYNNFTSNHPQSCPIISHQLATNKQNLTKPIAFEIIQGSQQFIIQNVSMSLEPFLYDFYIISTALGGAQYKQHVFIQTLIDCRSDVISLVTSFPDISDPNYQFFGIQNNIPVLIVNQSLGQFYQTNLKNRFKNVFSKYCPLKQFQIAKVMYNNQEIKEYQNYFSISQSGQLLILPTANKQIQNYLVYIKVFNGLIWGGDEKYIADISLYQISINKSLPYFITYPLQININIANIKGDYIFDLPLASNNTQQMNIQNQQDVDFVNIFYNSKSQSSQLKFNLNKIQSIGQYILNVSLINQKGEKQNYNIQLNISNSNPQIVSAKIVSINQYGLVKLQFDNWMILNKSISWINYTLQNNLQFNTSWINQSNTILQVLPALGRDRDEGFYKSQIDLKWNCTSVTNTTILFQIIFESPLQISPLITQDKLNIIFNGSQYFFVSKKYNINLDKSYWNMTHKIRKQMPLNIETQQLNSSGEYMKKLMLMVLILGIVMNILGNGCLEYMILFFRSLQIVVHFPIMQVVFPANILTYIQFIVKIVWFDIEDGISFFDQFYFLKFDENAQPPVISQMKDIGYEDRNAFTGLKTLTFVLILYFIRVLIALFLFIFVKLNGNNKVLREIHQFFLKGLFFNTFIRLSMEAYYEFFLIGFMNFQTANYQLNGEILGISETYFVFLLIFILLPVLSIFIVTKSQKFLRKKQVKKYIGELYESTKIKSNLQKSYILIFVLRRFGYLFLATFVQDQKKGGLQIIGLLTMNLLWTNFIGHAEAQKQLILNRNEKINELFVQLSTALLILFTDCVNDQIIKYIYGWFMVATITFLIVFNLFFIFKKIALILFNIFKLALNYSQSYFKKFFGIKKEKKYYVDIQISQIDKQQILEQIFRNQQNNKSQLNKTLEIKKNPINKNFHLKKKKININNEIKNFDNILDSEDGQITFRNTIDIPNKEQINKKNSNKYFQGKSILDPPANEHYQKIKNKINKNKIDQEQLYNNQQKFQGLTNKQNDFKFKDLNDQKLKFLKNIRERRNINNKTSNQKDKSFKNFENFVENNGHCFMTCQSKDQSYGDIIQDILYFAYLQSDSLSEIRLKQNQISQYAYNQIILNCKMDDPFEAYNNFDRQLFDYTEKHLSNIQQ